MNRFHDEVVAPEIGTLRSARFFEADDSVFCENTEVSADLSFVTLNPTSEGTDRFDLLAVEYVDEFAALLRQDALGTLVTDDLYARHSALGECAGHFLPAFSTKDFF